MNNIVKVGAAALAIVAMQSVRADSEEPVAEETTAEETAAVEETEGSYGWTPIAFGLATPVQLPWGYNRWDVFGLDLNLFYSEAPLMYGLQLSLGGNMAERAFYGCGLDAIFNWSKCDTYGLRGTLGLNYNNSTVYGLELGAVGFHNKVIGADIEFACNIQKAITGFSASILGSYTMNESRGCTMGCINIADVAYGAQIAFAYNQCNELNGAQVALVNYARECKWGFQIGIVNIILDNQVKVLPFVNGYF